MKLTAHTLGEELLSLYEAFGWDLIDKFEHGYEAFKMAMNEPEKVFSKIKITDKHKEHLLANITKKMAAAPQKLRTTFNLQCYTFEGVEAIRESLLEAKKQTSDE